MPKISYPDISHLDVVKYQFMRAPDGVSYRTNGEFLRTLVYSHIGVNNTYMYLKKTVNWKALSTMSKSLKVIHTVSAACVARAHNVSDLAGCAGEAAQAKYGRKTPHGGSGRTAPMPG